jgi:DNA-binding LacI/PurR family transcriptional regulator
MATERDALRALVDDYPVVLTDESIPSLGHLPTVTSDNYQGGRLSGEHLRGLGHEKAVVLAGPPEFTSTKDRVRGFKEFFPNALVLHGDFDQQSATRLVGDLLSNDVAFTCLMAGNDDMAVGAIRRLEEAGLRVPADVSVLGFDDVDFAWTVSPGLTTVHQPAFEMGNRAAAILIESLVGREPAAAGLTELPVELVVRKSTGPARVFA